MFVVVIIAAVIFLVLFIKDHFWTLLIVAFVFWALWGPWNLAHVLR